MPAKNAHRGRPKGSGLDDSGQLAAIADLIAKNPELKPTTAIKSLGVSDPSTIRRLRDKYRKFQNSSETKITKSKAEFDQQPKRSAKSVARAQSLKTISTPTQKIPAPRQPRSPKPLANRAADKSLGEPSCWFNSWSSLGMQSIKTTIDVQLAAYRSMIEISPITFYGQTAIHDQ